MQEEACEKKLISELPLGRGFEEWNRYPSHHANLTTKAASIEEEELSVLGPCYTDGRPPREEEERERTEDPSKRPFHNTQFRILVGDLVSVTEVGLPFSEHNMVRRKR